MNCFKEYQLVSKLFELYLSNTPYTVYVSDKIASSGYLYTHYRLSIQKSTGNTIEQFVILIPKEKNFENTLQNLKLHALAIINDFIITAHYIQRLCSTRNNNRTAEVQSTVNVVNIQNSYSCNT